MKKRVLKIETVRIFRDQKMALKKLDAKGGYNDTLREIIDVGLSLSRKLPNMKIHEILPFVERLIDASNES